MHEFGIHKLKWACVSNQNGYQIKMGIKSKWVSNQNGYQIKMGIKSKWVSNQNGGRSSQKFQHFKDDSEGDR